MNALCLLETIYLYALFAFAELTYNASKKTESMGHKTKQTETFRKRYLVSISRL
jgi:hypothetical protein